MQNPDYSRWQMLLEPSAQAFIAQYAQTSLDKVALLKPKYPHIPFPEVIEQMDSLRKVGEKFPAWAHQTDLLFPSLAFQQASSEATAQYKSRLMQADTVADLTGGWGVDTFYLAQACRQVHHIEQNADLQQIARHNFARLQQANVVFCAQSTEDFLSNHTQPFDALYIDPARRGREGQKLVQLADYSPNVLEILPAMRRLTAHIWLKTSPLLDIAQTKLALPNISEVFVIAHAGEVKELLFHIDLRQEIPLKIHAVTLAKAGEQVFSFDIGEEINALPAYGAPNTYLYEPFPALMKAGGFKIFATRYNLQKLHPHTHLYTSDTLIPDLPARAFVCKGVYPYKKKALPTQKANITARNFRDSVAQIRQKLGIADGGEHYIFATTLLKGEQVLLLTEKISPNV